MISQYPESLLVNYATKGKAAALSVPLDRQVSCFNLRAINNSGGAISVGICRKIEVPNYKLFNKVGSTITNITTISSTQNIFTTTANDGYYVQSSRKFGLFGLTVSTAQAGGVFTYTYWNGSFTTLTTVEVPTDYSTTGDKFIVFRPPADWVVGNGVSGLDSDKYTIRVLGTTGPGGTVAISSFWIAEFLDLYSGVANNAAVQLSFPDSKPFVLNGSEGLFPYFSTANAANQFGAFYASI